MAPSRIHYHVADSGTTTEAVLLLLSFGTAPTMNCFRSACYAFAFSFVGLFATVALGQDDQQAAETKAPPPAIASIDTAMQGFVDAGVASGVVTLVARDGEIVHLSAVGLSDLEAEKKMRPSSLFSIASMTKPITATSAMILVEEGKLNLDDKVSKYLPAFANCKLKDGSKPSREITIRDAITHMSGLNGKQTFAGSLAEAVDEIATRPLAFDPGTKWQYSPGLNVVGRVVEIVAKQPLEQFMKERIFAPLKMSNTTFTPDETQRKRIATLYAPGKKENGEDKKSLVPIANRIGNFADVKGPNPSGGLVASARDMFRFYQMILNDGKSRKQQIVSADSIKQMTSLQSGELKTGFTPGNGWGLGWCIIREPQEVTGMLSAGTFGHGGAFGTQGWVDPKTKTIYVLMIQRDKLPNADGSEIRKAFQQAAVDALK